MRGYPKGPLGKMDFENLIAIPEHADQAKASLEKLAAIDDSTISVDQGTQDVPRLIKIDNPQPSWKRAGFQDKIELVSLADLNVEPEIVIEMVRKI